MGKEQDIIKLILNALPRSKYHINEFFESDAELFSFGNEKYLFSTDEFSKEDLFLDHDPYTLGRNLAIGTISDILASGGIPLVYGHSLAFETVKWNEKYIRLFSEGIASVLKEFDIGFIGGDTSQTDSWRYTGIVIGKSLSKLSRIGCSTGDLIFMTGNVGGGNVEAALNLYSENLLLKPIIKKYGLKLQIRINEVELIRKYATACIDSSDGVFDSVETFASLNNVGYVINNLPYCSEGKSLCKLLGKPLPLLFLGECGEYEFVFTIKPENAKYLLKEADDYKLIFNQIGEITNAGSKILINNKNTIDLSKITIRARDFNSTTAYLNQLTDLLLSQ